MSLLCKWFLLTAEAHFLQPICHLAGTKDEYVCMYILHIMRDYRVGGKNKTVVSPVAPLQAHFYVSETLINVRDSINYMNETIFSFSLIDILALDENES